MDEKKKIRLTDIPRKDVFTTPENYFDALGNRITAKLPKAKGRHVFMSLLNERPIAAAAAAVVMFATIAFAILVSGDSTPSASDLLADVPAEDCMLYLQQTDMDAVEILSLIDTEGLFEDDEALPSYPELDDVYLDELYEKFGVTEDEKLKTL